jgi:N-acetylglucosaminyldiphosphoundecaprenol N-acetyl-beta-D-mannosaminyltransferase
MIFNKLLTDSEQILQIVSSSIREHQSLLLTYFNQHCFNIYNKNSYYRDLIDKKFTVYQADLGMYFALKLFIKNPLRRIIGTELNNIIINELSDKKIPIAIVGGNYLDNIIVDKTKEKRITVIKYINGYFNESKALEIIKELKESNAKVYFIGMGVPKQELFAEQLSKSIPGKVIICVGNFFEFYFGTKKRAPFFIKKIGLEWMFRLLSEPKRLWKRYILGIPYFFYRIMKYKFRSKYNEYRID